MIEERVIDGVLHVLEGKTFRPLTAEELTQRLLAERAKAPTPYVPFREWLNPVPGVFGPVYIGDVIPNPYEITCGDMVLRRSAQ